MMHVTSKSTTCRHQRNQTLKSRLLKACLLLLATMCAGVMGRFAHAQARPSGLRFDRLENLEHKLPEPVASVFFVACMAFAALAYYYYHSNDNDEHQKPILVLGAMAGLLAALSLDFGVFLGIFALEPWFLLLGLVVSDCFHSIFFQKPRYAECEKEVFDDEKP